MAKFEVGQLVRVKEYDTIVDEFDTYDGIDIPSGWNACMEELCGKEWVVQKIVREYENKVAVYYLEGDDRQWYVDECILEEIIDDPQIGEISFAFEDAMGFPSKNAICDYGRG